MRSKALLLILLPFLLLTPFALLAVDVSTPSLSRAGGVIAVTADGETLLVVNPDSNTLSIVDLGAEKTFAEVPVGTAPRAVALPPGDTLAYVTNQRSNSISVVDLLERMVTEEVAVGDRPVGVAVSPDGRLLAVAEMGADRVRLLDLATLETSSLFDVKDRPYGLAFTPDGESLLVTHLLSGDVTRLSVPPFRLHLPLVLVRKVTSALSGLRRGLAEVPLNVIPTWPNVAPAPSVVVNRTGTRAYLPQTMANGLGLNVQFDNTVFPKVSVLNLETDSHQTSEHISLPETDQPVGLPWSAALSQNEGELWVVNAASNDVSVVDISTPTQPRRVAHLPVGDNPRGIAISPDGSTAYVNNTLAGTVSVIDTQAYTVTGVITTTQIPLPPLTLRGKRLFHSSARPDLAQARWISCNTCHVEGEHDGRTWLLQFSGEVPIGATPVITRNTTSLLGMIQTYPLRWSGEWNESADSEFAIRFEQFGTGLIEGEIHPTLGSPNQGRDYDLDSLAAFIDSLQIPSRSHALTAAELWGKMVFESPETGCATCHPPPYYADFRVHDVGTAEASGEWFGPEIDTPTLRFLYDSAPYLHDGSARTLLEVLTTSNPDDRHGATSHLTDKERSDLIAFLLALPFDR